MGHSLILYWAKAFLSVQITEKLFADKGCLKEILCIQAGILIKFNADNCPWSYQRSACYDKLCRRLSQCIPKWHMTIKSRTIVWKICFISFTWTRVADSHQKTCWMILTVRQWVTVQHPSSDKNLTKPIKWPLKYNLLSYQGRCDFSTGIFG